MAEFVTALAAQLPVVFEKAEAKGMKRSKKRGRRESEMDWSQIELERRLARSPPSSTEEKRKKTHPPLPLLSSSSLARSSPNTQPDLDCVLTVMALSVASARDSDGDAAASTAAEAAARALSSGAASLRPAQRLSALSALHGASPPGSAGRTAALRGALAVARGAVAEAPAAAVSSGAAALSAAARTHGAAWAAADAGGDEAVRTELLLALAEVVRSGAPGKRAAARDAAKLAGAALGSEASSSASAASSALAGPAAERAVADFLSSPDAASFDLAGAPAVKALSSSKSGASGKALAAALEAVLKGDTEAAAAACEGASVAALASAGVSRSHVESKARLIALLRAAEAAPGGVLTFEAVERALALPAGGAARALVAAGGASGGAAVVRVDGKAKTAHVARRAPLYPSCREDYAALASGLKRWAESGRAVVEKFKAQAAAEATGRET